MNVYITNHSEAESTVRPAASLRYSTTQFVVVSLCRVSLHDNIKFNGHSFSLKVLVQSMKKKAKKKEMITVL